MSNPKIVALIPARSGSKGVPDKNIRMLGGEPLIKWAISVAKKSTSISRVLVSTDCERYAEIALGSGAEVPFLRPSSLSKDNSTDFEFVDHALTWMRNNESERDFPDYLVHLRPTTPFRDPRIIDQAVSTMVKLADRGYSALRSIHEMPESAYKAFEISNDNRLVTIFERNSNIEGANIGRQQLPDTYCANGYVDVLSTKFISENGVMHGERVYPFKTDISFEIDVESDFDWLEYWLKRNPALKNLSFGL